MAGATCPYCNHKPFRNGTGLQWHLKHIHDDIEPRKAQLPKSTSDEEAAKINYTQVNQDLSGFKQGIEESVSSRLNIFTKRDAWLSERISKLEQSTNHQVIPLRCTLQKSR